jgi:hypothetical protein
VTDCLVNPGDRDTVLPQRRSVRKGRVWLARLGFSWLTNFLADQRIFSRKFYRKMEKEADT